MVIEVHDINEEGFDLRLEARLKNAALVRAREEMGLTQKKAAELIGIHPAQYCGFETMRNYPGPRTRKKICDFYGLPESKVFPRELRGIESTTLVFEGEIPKERLLSLTESSTTRLLPPVYIEGNFDEQDRREIIERALGELKEREAAILRLHFGLGEGQEPMTYDQIGAKCGITGGRAQQIAQRALNKLRGEFSFIFGRRIGGLAPYLEDYAVTD